MYVPTLKEPLFSVTCAVEAAKVIKFEDDRVTVSEKPYAKKNLILECRCSGQLYRFQTLGPKKEANLVQSKTLEKVASQKGTP